MGKPKEIIEPPNYEDSDSWVTDPQFIRELGICNGTKVLYDKDAKMHELGWPPPMRMGQRNYRSRRAIEKFKSSMLKRAMEQRRQLVKQVAEKAA